MRILRIIFVTMMFGSLMAIVVVGDNIDPTTYISFVHDGLGFYKIRNLEMPPRPFTYENRVLNVNKGDTVIWENDADRSTLTIVSDQNLWDNKIGQIKVGNRINYKFENSGTYTFYIKEASSRRQTIVVGSIGDVQEEKIVPIQTPLPTITTVTVPISSSTVVDKYVPTPSHTVISTPRPIQTPVPIKIPVKITPTTIASVIVAMISIYMTYRSGKR